MDQAAAVLGDEGYVLPLLCQPCQTRPLVRLPEMLRCWAVDSGVSHAVTGIEYEAARAAAFMGYKMICDQEGLPVTRDSASRIPRFTDSRWRGYLSEVTPVAVPLEIRGTASGGHARVRSFCGTRSSMRILSPGFCRRSATVSGTVRAMPRKRTSAFSCSWNSPGSPARKNPRRRGA